MEEIHIPALHKKVPSQLTTEQEHYLENALNPFPDYAKEPARMPAHENTSTAVKNIQKIIDISAPTLDNMCAESWNCNVFLLPTDGTVGFGQKSAMFGAALSGVTVTSPAPFLNINGKLTSGLLMVVKAWDIAANGGTDASNPFNPSFKPDNSEIEFMTVSDGWVGEGAARLTSCGYEITDNTAELYRAGNMVNWRKTSAAVDVPLNVTLPGLLSERRDAARVFSGFPDSIAAAFRIPGSTSRRFTEGTYVVGTFNHNKEDFELPNGLGCAVMASSRPEASSTSALFVGGVRDEFLPDIAMKPNFFTFTHLDHSGSFCTGLSPQATFTIALKATLEIVPNANSVLIDFARPSIPYNPRVDELYNRVAAELPASVPVADNNAGDFFKKIVQVATPIVSQLFPAAAPVVGAASGLATKGINALQQNRQKKKAKKAGAPGHQLTKNSTKSQIGAEIQRLTHLMNNM